MAGLNLHKIVNRAVSVAQPQVDVKVYQSTGTSNVMGVITPMFAPVIDTKARFQSDVDKLEHKDNVEVDYTSRKIYVDTTAEAPISELYRNRGKTNDYIYRVSDQSWWMVTEVLDDFAEQGWVCVRGVLQVLPPIGVIDEP